MTNIANFKADDLASYIGEFGQLLHACVHDGASIGFILPFATEAAEAFWSRKVLPALHNGRLVLLIAQEGSRIAGTVQLDYDTPPNQPHRAEVRKLMVHPDFRRRGIAKKLIVEIEHVAHQLGRTLLTLDTRTGDMAEPLYESLGYRTTGIIPGYCRDTLTERLDSTTIMYKAI